MCVCVCTCCGKQVDAQGQLAEVSSLLPTMCILENQRGIRQVLLPTELSQQLLIFVNWLFCFQFNSPLIVTIHLVQPPKLKV